MRQRSARVGDRLPYSQLVSENVLALRDGGLMASIAIAGLPFETEDAAQLDHLAGTRDVLLRSIIDARFVLYHHIVRRRVSARLEGEAPDGFAGELDRKWRDRIGRRTLYVNDQFLTLVRRPARGKTGWPERLARRLRGARTGPDPAAVRELSAAAMALVTGLAPHGARLLGSYATRHGTCSELLELLSLITNGDMQPVLVPPDGTDIGHHIAARRLSFGLDALERRGALDVDFAAMLSLKEYPATAYTGILDELLRLPCEFVLTESYAPSDRQIARERIDLALRRLSATSDDSATERREMLMAKDALVSGQAGFGDHHLGLLVRAGDLAALDQAIASAAATLADTGAIVTREDINLEPAFWAQFPGNEQYIVRKALVSSANAACLLSLHGFPMGSPDGNLWGPAITLLETTSGTPYFFNWHVGDLGHFTVIGPSGSGKTVVLNFLAAQAQKLHPRTVLFDKDRGSELFVRAMEGHYARIRPGEATGFNPLALADTPVNRAFLAEWLALILQPRSSAEQRAISAAIDISYDHDQKFRRLRHFRELLAGNGRPEDGDIAARLAPWTDEGPMAWLFDNAADALDMDQALLGFDITELLDTPSLRTPVLMYLFHRINERLDGTPTIILIDEGWKALDDPVFAARIRDWMKTLRKRNAIVGFGTQSARDALDSKIAPALTEQAATQIFMANPRATAEDYCAGFGLTPHELDLVRGLPAASRCFLVRHGNHSVVVRLDLSGLDNLLTILSGREASVRQLDRLREEHGDDPAAWYPVLTGAPWPMQKAS